MALDPSQWHLILHNGLAYITNDRGVLALTAGDHETKWRYDAGVEPDSFAISDDIAYLGAQSEMRGINLPAQ
jgi:outer membrane protein assembly factor BamB